MNARRRRTLLTAMFVDTLGGGLLAPFELVYALRISHLSLTGAGLVLSLAAAAGIATGPIAGAATDRVGPARVAAAANAVGVGGCATLLLWTTPWGYGLGALLLSANLRVFWAAFTPLVASAVDPVELERWFGRLRGARYVGIVAGEGLSGLFFLAGADAGLRLLVVANGLSFIAAFALIVAVAGPARAAVDPPPEHQPARHAYRRVLADRLNVALAVLNVAATFLLVAPMLMLPVFILDRLGLGTWVPGALAALLTATAAGGLVFGGRLVRGRRRLRNLEHAAALWAVGCATFLFASIDVALAYASLFAGVVLLGLGEAIYAPTADALPAALAPPELRGRYAAVHQMAWGISEALAPGLGAVALTAGSATLWLALAAIAAGTAGAYRLVQRPAGGRDGVAGDDLGRAVAS